MIITKAISCHIWLIVYIYVQLISFIGSTFNTANYKSQDTDVKVWIPTDVKVLIHTDVKVLIHTDVKVWIHTDVKV
jgi:propanediol utilization protein